MPDDHLWWRVAWRNLWRNRGRTWITVSALAFGYLSSVVMVGLSDGMGAQLVENGTGLLIGQAQVHAEGYLPERSLHGTIGGPDGTDVDALLARLEGHPDVLRAAPRLYGAGLVSGGDHTEAAVLLGIDAERERDVTTLLDHVTAGRPPRAGAREVAVGAEMARQLGVSIGEELVLVAPAADGSMGNDLYVLVGTFDTGTPGVDGAYAVLALEELQSLVAMEPARIHEVALAVSRPVDTPAIAADLAASLGDDLPPLEVRPWTELRPELAESVALVDSLNFVIVVIIFAMAVFGVANTLIIGTFERTREFAVVRALGSSTGSIARTVVYEAVVLGALALAAGALATWPLLVWWHNDPPDLSSVVGGFSWSGSQWRPVLRVEYSADTPVIAAVALFLTAVVAALYPAWKAARIPPADALAGR